MKKAFTFLFAITNFMIFAQTTYTFTGNGNWTDTSQWDGNNAPGLTISPIDTVIILGSVNIDGSDVITNNGNIQILNGVSTFPVVNIDGQLINNSGFTITNGTINNSGTIKNTLDFIVNNSAINNSGIISNDKIGIDKPKLNLTGSASVLNNTGTITNSSGSTLTTTSSSNIINKEVFNNFGVFNSNAGFSNEKTASNSGTIESTKTFTNETTGGFTNTGVFVVSDASQISNLGAFINDVGSSVIINDSSTLRVFSSATFNNKGIITNNSGTIDLDNSFINDGTIINKDKLDLNFGITLLNNSLLINDGEISNAFSTLMNATSGFLINNNTIINGFNGDNFTNSGILRGNNTSHTGMNFINTGIIDPGNNTNSIGTYKVDERLGLSTTSIINIEIESLTSFDKIETGNATTLNGVLNIMLLNGYEPTVGDSFEILTASSISNTLITNNLPALSGNKVWEVTYNANNIVLNVKSSLTTNDFSKSKFAIYPNPSSSILTIRNLKTAKKVILINTLGQSIFEKEISNINNKINISMLTNGLYFLRIDDTIKQFIKN